MALSTPTEIDAAINLAIGSLSDSLSDSPEPPLVRVFGACLAWSRHCLCIVPAWSFSLTYNAFPFYPLQVLEQEALDTDVTDQSNALELTQPLVSMFLDLVKLLPV